MNTASKIIPDLNGPNAPHWHGAREGKVVVQVCSDCGRPRYPSTHLCPACASADASWKAIRPTGRVRSWCRFHQPYFAEFKARLPYTVLIVRMDDGLDLFSNFVSSEFGATPVIGQALVAAFEEVAPDICVVRFRAA